MAQEAIDEDLARVAQADAARLLVEGADEDDAPEAVDGVLRLMMGAEPVEEGRVRVGRGELQAQQAPGNAKLVAGREVVCEQEAPGQVQRRGQVVRAERADAPVGRHEVERALRLEQVVDAGDPAKVREVGAAAHRDVLAGVERLPRRRVGERPGPAADAVARLVDRDFVAPAR